MHEISLNSAWSFTWMEDSAQDSIIVDFPHTFAKNGQPRRGIGIYRKTIPVDSSWKQVYLSFDAVDQCCEVYANDTLLGTHQGGYSRFRLRIPEALLKSEKLELEVRVDNRVNEHVSPHFGDFTVYGGIPRPVSLLICEDAHFDYAYYGTNGVILRTETQDGDGLIHAEIHAFGQGTLCCRIRVVSPEGKEINAAKGNPTDLLTIRIPSPRLWDGLLAAPLYQVITELYQDGQLRDSVCQTIGFRSMEADGNGLRLNGKPCFLRGVAKHQDRADSLTAATREGIHQDFEIISELGANAVRLSHYQHPQAAYEECDRRGLLAWAEIPMLKMTEDTVLQENAARQLTELILQNLHHPSIFCWGIQNEIAMFRDAPFMHEACRKLHALAKQLDPYRVTACANLYPVPPESELNGITDLVGYNYYFGWYYGEWADYGAYLDRFHQARPETPLGITEYGADANPALHSANPKVKDYSEEYQALFHERVYPDLRERKWLWGSFIWNMFDFSSDRRNEGGIQGLNSKGLVSWDRTLYKDAFYYYQAQWSDKPVLHLCGKRYLRRAAEQADIKAYSNLPEAELWINEKLFGKTENDGNGVLRFESVPLRMGENHLKLLAGGLEDTMVLERVESEDSAYRLPEVGDGRVTNWFLQGELKKDCFSILNTAQQVLTSPAASDLLRETFPALYSLLTEKDIVPLGLTMKSILERDIKDPDRIGRFQQALQEIPLEQ